MATTEVIQRGPAAWRMPRRHRRGAIDAHDETRRARRTRVQSAPWTSSFAMLLAVVVVLEIVGLVMVLSASSVSSQVQLGNPWYYFQRQLQWGLIGLVMLVICVRVDYHRWRQFVAPLYFASVGLLTLVMIPGVGISRYGATRWLGTSSISFQPSELAKLSMVLFAAHVLERRESVVGNWRQGVRPVILGFSLVALLVVAQPDLGTAISLFVILLAMLVVGGARWRHIGAVTAVAAAGAGLLTYFTDFRRARLFAFVDPWADPSNTGYQIVQSLIALGSGKWTGVGLGASRAKWFFLPNAHNDFIFAIIGEELGLTGCLLVVAMFAAFAVLGVRASLRAPDRFGMLIALGITAWITGQAVVNIGAVSGALPVTGIPLPFVSFGGTALVVSMAGAGMLLNVARQGR